MRSLPADGLLLVDKPAGITSHDVVAAARRALGEKRIGHAGTLDPFATGLLVLLVGRATRLLPHMDGDPKVYDALIRFGAETDTDDRLGRVVREAPLPAPAAVDAALPSLTGDIDQIPPAYSAKRVDGARAYALARAGQDVVLAPSRVRVDAWALGAWSGPDAAARVTCGGGTYIRSLARDLGRLVGSAAHLAELRRVRSGPFDVQRAASLEDLVAGRATVLPPRAALASLPAQPLAEDDVARVARGIDVPATVQGERALLLNGEDGPLVAFAVRRGDRWQPRVVMREP